MVLLVLLVRVVLVVLLTLIQISFPSQKYCFIHLMFPVPPTQTRDSSVLLDAGTCAPWFLLWSGERSNQVSSTRRPEAGGATRRTLTPTAPPVLFHCLLFQLSSRLLLHHYSSSSSITSPRPRLPPSCSPLSRLLLPSPLPGCYISSLLHFNIFILKQQNDFKSTSCLE